MLKLYNTLSRKKEPLKARPQKKISLFVCGPTVYDFSHLGHARTYIFFDAFVRFLRFYGYKVDYLQNITDIDDKIIQRAKNTKESPLQLARRFEKEYKKDMKALGIISVSKYARATKHIKEIISQIKRLLKKGYAYEIQGDGLYYDILKFKDYGKLSGRTSLGAEDAVSRIDEAVKKRNKGDFALWKISKKGEPKWKSPWGFGRPGWHIEDTAITEKRFGTQYELHGGARDLIFPHHEAEIAQMEAISGKKPMAKHWLHSGFLTVEGVKMSKSLGNFITVQDFLKKHSPRVLRLLVLKAHYRSPIDYSEKLIFQVERSLERIDEFVSKLEQIAKSKSNKRSTQLLVRTRAFSEKALNDDFNTALLIGGLFAMIGLANVRITRGEIGTEEAVEVITFLKEIDEFLGFIFWKRMKKKDIPSSIVTLLQKRESYRKAKQWQKADEIRKKLLKKGWQLDDTPKGPRLKKIS